jgi:hypothetical protein
MMILGTSHFETLLAAINYYESYGLNQEDVIRKLDEHEIHIGKPNCLKTDMIYLDKDKRYTLIPNYNIAKKEAYEKSERWIAWCKRENINTHNQKTITENNLINFSDSI